VSEILVSPRAPLAGALKPGRHGLAEGPPGVTLRELPFLASAAITLRAGGAATLAARLRDAHGIDLPPRPGCTMAGALTVVWTGPGQWLALRDGLEGAARFGFARDLAALCGAAASVTDLTGARAVLCLAGPAAPDVLRKLVPVDVDDSVFPTGAAALTVSGHIGVTLWRMRYGWHLACYRSFGASLAEAVLDAAAEFGCEIVAGR
jgi:sarcosine oxidase subunit gamma